MAKPLVVVGAGGFGRETLDVVEAVNASAGNPVWNVLGVVDDALSHLNRSRLADRQYLFLGPVSELQPATHPNVVVAIGHPETRERVATTLTRRGFEHVSLFHPSATLGTRFVHGVGTVVCAGVSVGTNVRVGDHVHLNPHAVVGHDALLGNCVSVNPNATISGECTVEDKVLIGASATVLQGLQVLGGAVVGAAACVTRDVPSGAIRMGVPAR